MKDTFKNAAPTTLLSRVLVVMCAVFVCVVVATPTAFAQPCDDGDVSAEAEDPCSTSCPGESPDDGDCSDECQFCNCCQTAAPAALACKLMSSSINTPAFRGDLPPPFAAIHGGISLGVFKPPRHLSA